MTLERIRQWKCWLIKEVILGHLVTKLIYNGKNQLWLALITENKIS